MSHTNEYVAGKVLCIDKPLNWTSFDVVKKIRASLQISHRLKKIKVGHAGTLDPLATGVLIICTGAATKTIDSILATEKEYTGTFTLGKTTPSFDLETEVDKEYPTNHLTPEHLSAATKQFLGDQEQIPPIYSAKKIEGTRAYDKARQGEEVKMRPSFISISQFEVETDNLPEVAFRLTCSKGTYVRSLARDFGEAVESGAHLSSLRRTRVGNYRIEEALSIEEAVEQIRSTGVNPTASKA